jgi:hypothetical protein
VADGEDGEDDDVEQAASMTATRIAPPSDRHPAIVLPCTRRTLLVRSTDGQGRHAA